MDRILLEESCEILDSRRIPITASNRKEGPYPYYGANGIQDYVDDYIFDDELVLLAEDGGNFGSKERPIAYRVSGKCWVNNHAHVLKPKDGINVDYLCYSLMFYDTEKLVNGATRQKLTQAMMRKMLIPKRSISEQKKIVATLNTIRDSITKQTKRIKLLDNLIKARFVEMFGNYKMEKTIGEVATICRGASPRPISKFITESNGENWIKIGDVKEDDTFITKTKELVTEDGANRSRRIKPGDFILSNSMSFGRPYISKIYGCVHDGWLIISDYEQSFLPLFFYYAIRSELVQAQFRKSVAGAVVKNLNSDLVRSVKIVIPSIESQEKFASFVAQVDKSKFALSNELAMGNFYIRLIHDCIMHGSIDL